MNDGLLALKRLKGEGRGNGIYDEIDIDQDFDRAEYYLQALDIVKDKKINVDRLLNCDTAFQYNFGISKKERHLTQEEFGHLIEVFGND